MKRCVFDSQSDRPRVVQRATRQELPETTTPRTAPPAKPRRLVRLLGVRVVLGRGDALGQVVDVVTDEEGRVAYVVVRDADTLVAVPWGAVRYSGEDRAFAVTAQVTRARLQDVSFTKSRYPDFASETWLRSARAVWGEQALRGRPERGGTEGRRPGPGGTQGARPGRSRLTERPKTGLPRQTAAEGAAQPSPYAEVSGRWCSEWPRTAGVVPPSPPGGTQRT